MNCVTPQDVLDKFGFLVLAYHDTVEHAEDKARGFISGETINWNGPNDVKLAVLGEATRQEWIDQCIACADPVTWPGERPHIAFIKVTVE